MGSLVVSCKLSVGNSATLGAQYVRLMKVRTLGCPSAPFRTLSLRSSAIPRVMPAEVAFMAYPGLVLDRVRRSPGLISPFSLENLTGTRPARAMGTWPSYFLPVREPVTNDSPVMRAAGLVDTIPMTASGEEDLTTLPEGSPSTSLRATTDTTSPAANVVSVVGK